MNALKPAPSAPSAKAPPPAPTHHAGHKSIHILVKIIGAIVGLAVVAFVLMLCYNYAVVDGLSKDPETGDARMAKINFVHAIVLYLLLALFIAPTIVVR